MHLKLNKVVRDLQIDLRGKTVLTEAATGPYAVTAIMAALSGAEVYAFAKSSRFGSVEKIFDYMSRQMEIYGGLPIHLIDNLAPEIIGKADIITNSGHLRPLDKEKLRFAKGDVVVPLMYEAWEFRETDIDLGYCRQRNIPVGATNERHPDTDVFGYLGDMAMKLIFDSGLCLYRNQFVLICNNDFGVYIADVLSKVCSRLGVIDKEENMKRYGPNIDWLCDFPRLDIPPEYSGADAIILATSPFNHEWVGKNADISPAEIKRKFNAPILLRFVGDVDTRSLEEAGIRYYPEKLESGHMGVLPSDVGWDPVIRLQAGGLKVGQCLLEKEYLYKGNVMAELL